MDETVSVLVKKLEHAATAFPELQNEKILDVSVCLLYSCVRVESGYLYWWGVMPLGYRHRLWEKSRSKSKKNKALHSGSDFQVGSSVSKKIFIFFCGKFYFLIMQWDVSSSGCVPECSCVPTWCSGISRQRVGRDPVRRIDRQYVGSVSGHCVVYVIRCGPLCSLYDSVWPLCSLCDSEWSLCSLCDSEWPLYSLCDSEWPLCSLCDSEWPLCSLCDSVWVIVQFM